MKLIIDIPEKQYEYLAKIADVGEEPLGYFERVIMRGSPLPKEHGRLIDADELKTSFPTCDNSLDIKIASVRATINHAPTIIEAERGE